MVQWRYCLDEPSLRIVNETISLQHHLLLNSGTGMWDYFTKHTGIGTQEQLETIREHQRNIQMVKSEGQRSKLFKFTPGQLPWGSFIETHEWHLRLPKMYCCNFALESGCAAVGIRRGYHCEPRTKAPGLSGTAEYSD